MNRSPAEWAEQYRCGNAPTSLEFVIAEAMAQAREEALAPIKSATEILTIEGKVWIPAEKHEAVVNMTRDKVIDEVIGECKMLLSTYAINRILALKSK